VPRDGRRDARVQAFESFGLRRTNKNEGGPGIGSILNNNDVRTLAMLAIMPRKLYLVPAKPACPCAEHTEPPVNTHTRGIGQPVNGLSLSGTSTAALSFMSCLEHCAYLKLQSRLGDVNRKSHSLGEHGRQTRKAELVPDLDPQEYKKAIDEEREKPVEVKARCLATQPPIQWELKPAARPRITEHGYRPKAKRESQQSAPDSYFAFRALKNN
jgi:hypothetical protein